MITIVTQDGGLDQTVVAALAGAAQMITTNTRAISEYYSVQKLQY